MVLDFKLNLSLYLTISVQPTSGIQVMIHSTVLDGITGTVCNIWLYWCAYPTDPITVILRVFSMYPTTRESNGKGSDTTTV